jgi:hypothetical protein
MVPCKGAHGPPDLIPTCIQWSVAWPLRVGCSMGRGSPDVEHKPRQHILSLYGNLTGLAF